MKPLYKYFPLFVVILVVAIVSTGIYGGFIVRSLYYERITENLKNTAHILKSLFLDHAHEDIDAFCKTSGTEYTRVTIVDSQGVVLGDSRAIPATMENHRTRPEIEAAFRGRTGNAIRYSDTLGRNMVYLALPSFDFQGETIVLRTATPFSDLSENLRNAYTQITIAGAVILVLLSALGFMFMRRTNDALYIIRSAVQEYAKGNLEYRPKVSRPAALKRVADTISSLAADLLDRVHEVSIQRDELEAVFGGMEEAVIVLDTRLVIREMNDSAHRLTDFDPEKSLNRELLLVFRNSELQAIAEEVRTGKTAVEGEIVLFRERERFLQVHGSFISASGEEGERIVLVLNDVSRLKDLERVRKDFVANVSHELKTPITAVKGYVETLLDGDYNDHQTSEQFLKIILQNVDRLSAIVDDLLIISRLEKGSGPIPDLTPVDINDLARAVAAMYQQRADERGIDLFVEAPQHEVMHANQMLLEQAVSNLVDNALKYSDSGGSVKITVLSREDAVILQVSDRGSGIPEEHLGRIFERFYRIDKGRSRELGGTGLGLSIVKHVAVSHGGHVTVESTEGEGSTFSIVLPRVSPAG